LVLSITEYFIEEYLSVLINGSAPNILLSAVEFIKNNPSINKNNCLHDNGGTIYNLLASINVDCNGTILTGQLDILINTRDIILS